MKDAWKLDCNVKNKKDAIEDYYVLAMYSKCANSKTKRVKRKEEE